MLFRAENIPRTPNFKIAHCNTEARTELRELFYCRQAFIGNLAENYYRATHKVGVQSCKVYVKPEEGAAYYVINKVSGKLEL